MLNTKDSGRENFKDLIDREVFEDLIHRGVIRGCFIEVISLVHNVIEDYLRFHIEQNLIKIHKIDDEQSDPNLTSEEKYKALKKNIEESKIFEKFDILIGKKSHELKYLTDYNEIAYIFNVITKDVYLEIKKFNTERNAIIHKLLKPKKGKEYKYSEIIKIARLGRKIQLQLSPLNHNKNEIEIIIGKFDELVIESKKLDIN